MRTRRSPRNQERLWRALGGAALLARDFYTLRASEVQQVLYWADEYGYRKPKQANGSRARYFHALLQRRKRLTWPS